MIIFLGRGRGGQSMVTMICMHGVSRIWENLFYIGDFLRRDVKKVRMSHRAFQVKKHSQEKKYDALSGNVLDVSKNSEGIRVVIAQSVKNLSAMQETQV